MNRKKGRGKDMSWDLRALGGAVQLPCGELAWTKPQIFRVLASVEAMRGVVLGGDVLFGNRTYTGSSWQYCLSCEDHYVAFLRENCRGSRRTAEAFIRDFLATRSGEFLFAPVLREGVDAYIHRSTGALLRAMTAPHGRAADCRDRLPEKPFGLFRQRNSASLRSASDALRRLRTLRVGDPDGIGPGPVADGLGIQPHHMLPGPPVQLAGHGQAAAGLQPFEAGGASFIVLKPVTETGGMPS